MRHQLFVFIYFDFCTLKKVDEENFDANSQLGFNIERYTHVRTANFLVVIDN